MLEWVDVKNQYGSGCNPMSRTSCTYWPEKMEMKMEYIIYRLKWICGEREMYGYC